MHKTKKGFYNHSFLLSKKNLKEFKNNFIKKKVFKTNQYWFSRQKRFYFEMDESKLQIKVFNETNLGDKLEKKNFILIKLFFLLILRKILSQFIKFDKYNLIINNLINNLDFYYNKIKIFFVKESRLKKKLNQINEKFPSKVKFFLYLNKYLNNFKTKKRYKFLFEIGAGPAINACLLNYKYKTKSLIVDLQIQNIIAFLTISNFFPNLKVSFKNYRNLEKNYGNIEKAFKHYDIIFLPPEDLNKLPNNICDLSINICAFQEMSKQTIKKYILETKRILTNNNLFISINRKTKFLGVKQYYNFRFLFIYPLKFLTNSKIVFPKYNFSTRHIVSILKLK